jgi:acetyl-CoA C-acetyltransferase
VFDAGGTITAGNSSPVTDGASAVLLMSEKRARQEGRAPLAFIEAMEYAALHPREGLLMAPAIAVPRLLDRVGLRLGDIELIEIHEAFAAQVLCTLKAWESPEYCRGTLGLPGALGSIDRSKLNVKGGSVAIGHPFAATGTRILGTLAKLLAGNAGAKRGLVSVCAAGGMGVTAILER